MTAITSRNSTLRAFACAMAFLLALPGLAQSPAAGQPSQKPTAGRPIHIVPMTTPEQRSRFVIRSGASGHTAAGPSGAHLDYYGGPVMANVSVVVVFWTSGVVAEVQSKIAGFFSAIATSPYVDQLNEYTTTGATVTGGGSSSNQTIGEGNNSVPAYTITPSICASTSACTVTDAQLQTELVAQINAAHLPAPTYDSNNNPNTIYFVYFPANVTITDSSSNSSCVTWCAYHGTSTYSSKYFAYGVMPDQYTTACSSGCGSNATTFNNVTSVSSHEYAEAITDVAVGYAASTAPPLAWYDNTNGEVGDICNAMQGTGTNSSGYTVQLEWSNIQGKCVDGPAYFTLSAGTTQTAGLSFLVTPSAFDTAGATLAYSRTVHVTSSDGAATLPADAAFSTSPFSVTLNTPGTQTVTLSDASISSIKGTVTITVNPAATPTSTTVSATPNPAAAGATVTLTASVRGQNTENIPTGQVQFQNYGGNLGSAVALSNGVATTTTTSLNSPGIQSLTAVYAGTTGYATSSSASLPFQVNNSGATASSVSLGASPTISVDNSSVQFTATVTPSAATGSLLFQAYTSSNDVVTLGFATVMGGSGSVTTSALKPGTWTIKASYSGDATYAPSSVTISHVRQRKSNLVRSTNE